MIALAISTVIFDRIALSPDKLLNTCSSISCPKFRRPYRDRQSLSSTQSRSPVERERGPADALCEFCNCFQAPTQHDGTDPGPNVDRSVLALRIVSRWTNEKPGRLNREVIKLNVLPLAGEGTCLMLFSTRRHANLVSPTRAARDG